MEQNTTLVVILASLMANFCTYEADASSSVSHADKKTVKITSGMQEGGQVMFT